MVDETERLLFEVVRETERLIDQQIEAMEALTMKAERMARLAMAVLGATLSLGALVVGQQQPVPGIGFAAPLVAGGLFTLVALVSFVDAYVGLWRHLDLEVGVSAAGLLGRLPMQGWRLVDHLAGVIEESALAVRSNTVPMERSVKLRRGGVQCLVAGIVFEAIAFTYILLG